MEKIEKKKELKLSFRSLKRDNKIIEKNYIFDKWVMDVCVQESLFKYY